MPIEFSCPQCRLRLRTPDETAGKQAECPGCGTLVPIPYAGDLAAGEPSGGEIPPARFEPDVESAPNPYADPPLVNPYQAPVSPLSQTSLSRAELKGKLIGPAVGMIVAAAMSILYSASNLVIAMTVGMEQLGVELPNDPDTRAAFHLFAVVVNVALMIVPTLVLVGAISMLAAKSYAMAKAAAILALLPCGCCFMISLPFGIWGLMVLGDINVRAAFQSNFRADSTTSY